ncbi:DnaT-like ssDNA-binding protein, partial [Pseudomonas aeruginosa]
MAVVTEGDSANSYVSVDQATEYHAQRGNAAWASASNDSRSSALIRATDYIDRSYQFRGSKVDSDQPLEFPRTGLAWPNRKLQAATCELALLA